MRWFESIHMHRKELDMRITLIDSVVLGMGFVFGAALASIVVGIIVFLILTVLALFGIALGAG